MTDLSFILADITDRERLGSLFSILFWGFLIAALVWFIIWHLLGALEEEGDGAGTSDSSGSSTSSGSADSSKSEADAKAAKSAADAKAAAAAKNTAAAKAKPNAAAASAASADVGEKDDFSKLGLAGGTAQVLNAEGTTQYGQIADWSDDDVSVAASKFSESNPGVDFAELPWKANALANGVDLNSVAADDPAYGAAHKAPASVDHDSVIASNFSDEDVRNDNDLGVVYNADAVAGHVDDFQEIKGVGPKLNTELNKYGVYCFKQIANWSDHNVAEFSERLNCFKNRIERDRWIPQAASMECSDLPGIDTATADQAASAFSAEIASGSAKQDDTYGIVYTSAPDDVDDLKKIKGIANVLEGKLHGIGIYKFKQIAVWTNAACKEFSKMLTFKDRIYRDDWISQAKDFHEQKYNEKL